MEENRRVCCKAQYNFFAGSMYAYLALTQIPMVFYYMVSYINILLLFCYLFYVLACTILSVSLFLNKRNIIPCIGFFLLALFSLMSVSAYSNLINFFSVHMRMQLSEIISILLIFICYVLVLFFSVSQFLNTGIKAKSELRELWFIPVVCAVIAVLFIIGQTLHWMIGLKWDALATVLPNGLIKPIISGIIEIGAVAFSVLWIWFPEGVAPKKSIKSETVLGTSVTERRYDTSSLSSNAYCKMSKHVLLLIFTFGIWYLIWIYRTTDYLNAASEEPERDPLKKLLLCIFIPFYAIYWTYKSAQRIDLLSRKAGVSSDCTTLCLLMAIFIPIAAPIIMQDKINNIVMSNQNNKTRYNTDLDIAKELKIFKELLDNGTITQEEFDEKKKKLLDL